MKKIILFGLVSICLFGCATNTRLDVSKHLYKVSKGEHYGYLLGTNHSAKKYNTLDDYTEKAYEESDRLILEISMDNYIRTVENDAYDAGTPDRRRTCCL